MGPSSLIKSSLGIMLATFGLSSCDTSNLDLDLRNNNYDTSRAAKAVLEKRPQPDDRGIISYPNYQVAIARFGDTLTKMARRIGVDPSPLADYNGLAENEKLRSGEVIALPNRAAELGNNQSSPSVDVTQIAQSALAEIDVAQTPNLERQKPEPLEPIRHKVKRGETAFTISRLYNVTIRSLSDWNALDSDFNIREGQYLLIPLANTLTPPQTKTVKNEKPRTASLPPAPPSAKKALPDEEIPLLKKKLIVKKPTIRTPVGGILAYPVNGKIIREYVKNKNDGIDFSAPPGTDVVAADSGIVAAITSDANQVPIVVIKHENNLLTVYANIDNISVEKGVSVSRGTSIGKVGKGDPSYLHFEVRKGFESVDPMGYLR